MADLEELEQAAGKLIADWRESVAEHYDNLVGPPPCAEAPRARSASSGN